jgi:hypothetical protein
MLPHKFLPQLWATLSRISGWEQSGLNHTRALKAGKETMKVAQILASPYSEHPWDSGYGDGR